MSDYDSIQQRRNMIVGGFVVVGIVVFIYLIFIFGEMPVSIAKLTSFPVNVRFPSAPGVQENTPVQYCGYHIGRVTHVSAPMLYKNEKNGLFSHQVMVTIAIDNDYKNIPSNTRVELIRRGLGSSYVELKTKPMRAEEFDKLEPRFLQAGMELQGYNSSGNEFLPADIQDKMNLVVEKVTLLIDNVNTVIGDEANRDNLKDILANLSVATEESIETLKQIREFSAAGNETMKTANAKISDVSETVINTGQDLSEALIELKRVLFKINNGQGTVSKLLNDDRLYENLLDSSEELQLSIEKMKKTFEKTSKDGIQIKVF
ncbi:MAG: MlaD family protein [Anaerohalosphaeraceae bacterium]|nr:MlaD family protein [Anaerohalosphaeraceae bacterium]